jgi:hypothetical protein
MNSLLLSAVTVASAIAAPKDGAFRKSGDKPKNKEAAPIVLQPGAADSNQSGETENQRQERLIEEGVRSKPPLPPERDYVSVLKARSAQTGLQPNLAPEMRFSFGFGSWFPVKETVGRKSKPLGAHHVAAQVWSWNPGENLGSDTTLRESNYSSLSVFMFSSASEVSIDGFDKDGNPMRFSLLVNDLDSGLVYKQVFQWPHTLFAAGSSQFDLGLSFGYLGLRQRYLKKFGDATSKDADFLHSGAQFNASGTLFQVTFSTVLLSLFEAGIFVGAVTGFPFEIKAWAGLEIAFRNARQPEEGKIPNE